VVSGCGRSGCAWGVEFGGVDCTHWSVKPGMWAGSCVAVEEGGVLRWR